MSLSTDLREFIGLLNSRGVEYVIVGAHSLAFHARPRYTGDLDILVRPSPENAGKIVNLLHEFGFAASEFIESDFTEGDQMIQLGRVPNRIDLLTGISGVAVDEAFRTKISTEMEGLPVFVLSKDLLIQNKRAVGRPQDLADVAAKETNNPEELACSIRVSPRFGCHSISQPHYRHRCRPPALHHKRLMMPE